MMFAGAVLLGTVLLVAVKLAPSWRNEGLRFEYARGR